MGSRTTSPLHEPSSPVDGGIRKRVCKACDRCRLKKSKCDGSTPCSRCKADNAICVFGERKKSQDKVYPKGYVEMLESQQSQLVAGLQELYRRLQGGEGWTGPALKESTRGMPLTHDILEHLGALKSDNKTGLDHFEENYDTLQSILFANGAGSMRHEESFDTSSEAGHSPKFEMNSHPNMLPYPTAFSAVQFPPTPPIGSPHPFYTKTSSPLKAEMSVSTTNTQPYNQWPNTTFEYTNMEYDMTCETPIDDPQMQSIMFNQSMFSNPENVAINPCLTMKQWPSQDDPTQRYYSGTFT